MRHIISATAVTVVATGATEQLAMCGTRLGAYSAATAAGHIVGNYTQPATAARLTTCPDCASVIRTYIVDTRVCARAGQGHCSTDRVTVYHGTTDPTVVCGKHGGAYGA